jgi:dTDP-4-amino-4,6-dideoxygalactose transaminase
MINVTKTYLPPFDEYIEILRRAWDKGWITNNGELVLELETRLKGYLGVNHLWFTSNGTVVLQMALKALGITKEVITTPFSYVATTNAILWEGCKPVFVDIDPSSFCIDACKIEAAITPDTQAILATHVYGYPCDVEAIAIIAKKYGLKVIYDGAHSFGVRYKGKSLLSYGDLSTCSFHATKSFQTVEGGCIICNDDEMAEKLFLYRSFGHRNDDYFTIGINAKNSEFHAAMGLAVLPRIPQITAAREKVFETYNTFLPGGVKASRYETEDFKYNYSYYPVLFETEQVMLRVKDNLMSNDVTARRYFYPSLNLLPFLTGERNPCPVSEDISKRVLCLPLYHDLQETQIIKICSVIAKSLLLSEETSGSLNVPL